MPDKKETSIPELQKRANDAHRKAVHTRVKMEAMTAELDKLSREVQLADMAHGEARDALTAAHQAELSDTASMPAINDGALNP